jgi:hypothetical protein
LTGGSERVTWEKRQDQETGMQILSVWVPEPLDFPNARKVAVDVARKKLGEGTVLWSWCEAHSGRTSLAVDCCGSEEEPSWEVYGRVRGGRLKISVNGGQYEFCFGAPFDKE